MLTRKTPDTLATELTIKGQGETVSFNVTYHNRKQEDIDNVLKTASDRPEAASDVQFANRECVLFVVKDMEAEYPLSHEGLAEMESDRPGMIEALFMGFHKARRVEITKNSKPQ